MARIKNRTIFTGDNLPVLRGMEDVSVDLVYLDPPFNSNRNYEAPIGSEAAGASFKDAWYLEDTDDEWWGMLADGHPALYRVIDAAGAAMGKGSKAYCIYMAVRLLELRRVLKDTGSIWLHCDPTMSHPLKMMMDAIFGRRNFVNEVLWCYEKPRPASRKFKSNHDVLLFYGKGGRRTFNVQTVPRSGQSEKTRRTFRRPDGTLYRSPYKGKILGDWWSDIPSFATRMTATERTGYPTQKPLALLRRIVSASSNRGDTVLDPFCGCATACLAAEEQGRKWIGIDISPLAFRLINARMEKELQIYGRGTINRTDIPVRRAPRPSRDIKHLLFGRQEGRCAGCRHPFLFRNFTLDHVVPRAKGGQDTDENLQLLCGWCNSKKGDGTMAELLARLRREGFALPRP